MIHPAGDVEEYSLNNSSVVVQLVFGEVIFLFTGDIEKEAEEEILLQQQAIQSTILKVAHHGSRTSTLQSLPGIGPVTARHFIEYREEYGDFQNIQETTSVSGIGEVRFHDMKERITVGDDVENLQDSLKELK